MRSPYLLRGGPRPPTADGPDLSYDPTTHPGSENASKHTTHSKQPSVPGGLGTSVPIATEEDQDLASQQGPLIQFQPPRWNPTIQTPNMSVDNSTWPHLPPHQAPQDPKWSQVPFPVRNHPPMMTGVPLAQPPPMTQLDFNPSKQAPSPSQMGYPQVNQAHKDLKRKYLELEKEMKMLQQQLATTRQSSPQATRADTPAQANNKAIPNPSTPINLLDDTPIPLPLLPIPERASTPPPVPVEVVLPAKDPNPPPATAKLPAKPSAKLSAKPTHQGTVPVPQPRARKPPPTNLTPTKVLIPNPHIPHASKACHHNFHPQVCTHPSHV